MLNNLECIFCEIIKNREKPNALILGENEHSIAILDINPIEEGHSLIISKKHFNDVTVLDDVVWNSCFSLIKTVSENIKNKLKIYNFNLVSNIGKIAFQNIFHFHFHLIPKKEEEKGLVWLAERDLKRSILEIHRLLLGY